MGFFYDEAAAIVNQSAEGHDWRDRREAGESAREAIRANAREAMAAAGSSINEADYADAARLLDDAAAILRLLEAE